MISAIVFVAVYRHTPTIAQRLEAAGFTAKDMYKPGTPLIPTKGGIAQILPVSAAIIALPILALLISAALEPVVGHDVDSTDFAPSSKDFQILVVVLLFATFGLADDFLRFNHPLKLFIPILFAVPLARSIAIHAWATPFGTLPLSSNDPTGFLDGLRWSVFAAVIVLPIYVMVVTNLVNMHSGFNGLQTGSSFILLAGFTLKMLVDGHQLLTIAPAYAGACLAFYLFNRYPARLFEGNVGSLAVGAAIGSILVVNGYYTAGIVALAPHELNFLLYVYWRIRRKLAPTDPRWAQNKFGHPRDDRTIVVPNRLTLKWWLPSLVPMTERRATQLMLSVGAACMVAALFV